MRLNILHLSDFHFRDSEAEKCRRLGQLLAESTRDNRVDVIVFSGDLVNSVDDSFDNAYNALIAPTQTQHDLSNRHVLVVPGNHDKRHTEHQWVTDRLYACSTAEDLDEFLSDRERLELSTVDFKDFADFHRSMFPDWKRNDFGACSSFIVEGVSIGLVGLNSSWRCVQSMKDRGRLLFPIAAAKELYNAVEDCNIVLTSMHHHLGDFRFFVANGLEDLMQENSQLLLTGHYHKQRLGAMLSPKGCLLHNVAPATYNKRAASWEYGYTLLTVDTDTFDVSSIHYGLKKDSFSQIDSVHTVAMMTGRKLKAWQLRERLSYQLEFVRDMADNFILDDEQQGRGLTFEDLFNNPVVTETAEPSRDEAAGTITLHDMEHGSENLLLSGHSKQQMTLLLFRVWIDILRNYGSQRLPVIPFYVDCTRIRDRGDWLENQLGRFLGLTREEMLAAFETRSLLLLLDDVECDNTIIQGHLETFLGKYKHVRFIACTRDESGEKMTGNPRRIFFKHW